VTGPAFAHDRDAERYRGQPGGRDRPADDQDCRVRSDGVDRRSGSQAAHRERHQPALSQHRTQCREQSGADRANDDGRYRDPVERRSGRVQRSADLAKQCEDHQECRRRDEKAQAENRHEHPVAAARWADDRPTRSAQASGLRTHVLGSSGRPGLTMTILAPGPPWGIRELPRPATREFTDSVAAVAAGACWHSKSADQEGPECPFTLSLPRELSPRRPPFLRTCSTSGPSAAVP
jgi:hypothetical protein